MPPSPFPLTGRSAKEEERWTELDLLKALYLVLGGYVDGSTYNLIVDIKQWKDRILELESQLAAVKEELGKAKAEITRLSGKTGFCGMCESYAKKADRYSRALENLIKHYEILEPKTYKQLTGWNIATRTLAEGKE